MMWYGEGPGWGGWLAMTLVMLAFWGLLVAGGVALWRSQRGGPRHTRPPEPDAQRLLDERFARGEIDEEDYLRRRELLRSGR